MADFSDFKDQNWIDKKEELLRRANYNCAEDCDSRATHVHVCYYVKGRKIWELPDDAYKCYCRKDWETRRNAEDALRVSLAHLSISDLDILNETLQKLVAVPPNELGQMIEQMYSEAKKKLENAFAKRPQSNEVGDEEDYDD